MMSSNGFLGMAERVFPPGEEMVTDFPPQAVQSHTSLQSTISRGDSEPHVPPDSPGSSVSSRLQTEYEELLKYAIVVPTYASGPNMARTMFDTRPPMTLTKTQSTAAQTFHPTSSQGDIEKMEDENKVSKDFDETEPKRFDDSLSVGDESENSRGNPQQRWPTSTANAEYYEVHRDNKESGSGNISFDIPEEDRLQFTEGSTFSYSATIDLDVGRMNNLMEQWTTELKRNVMAEFGQSKIRMLEHHRQQMMIAKDRHSNEVSRLQNEIESMKELLHNYEQSIERKDQVITNLTNNIQRHQDKLGVQKGFSEWKIRHNDAKREAFASNLALRHYQRTLLQKVWEGWHSLIEHRWRQRVEKACQAKAQEVCMALTNDYETKLSSLNEALEQARMEVQKLHQERELYEETMKKAFMRGVCALNLEAMTMFQDGERESQARSSQHSHQQHNDDDDHYHDDAPNGYHATTIRQEPVFSTEPPGAPAPRVVNAQIGRQKSQSTAQPKVTADATKGRGVGPKVISAKLTARPDPGRTGISIGPGVGLAPPMSSVVVERHQPITKQTIGQATASKYIQTGSGQQQSSVIQRKIAGQGTGYAIPNIHTVKVVE